jgi:hypothetical protein
MNKFYNTKFVEIYFLQGVKHTHIGFCSFYAMQTCVYN